MKVAESNSLDITINGFQLKAKTWGNKEGNPILAIHGWLDNANSFDKIAPYISSDNYVVAIDLAGHGFSEHRHPNSSYYLWDYAIDLLLCIEQFGWNKVTLLAHSMGTGVAALIVAAAPKLVEKVIFIDGIGAPFVIKNDNAVAHFKNSIRHLKMAKKAKLYGFSSATEVQFSTKEEAIKDRMNTMVGSISQEAASCLIDRSLIKVGDGYRWNHDPRIALTECYQMTENQAQQFIQNIACKTLVILGKQGLFAEGDFSSRIQFKNATIHWVQGNHHLHLEDTHHEIVTHINQFI